MTRIPRVRPGIPADQVAVDILERLPVASGMSMCRMYGPAFTFPHTSPGDPPSQPGLRRAEPGRRAALDHPLRRLDRPRLGHRPAERAAQLRVQARPRPGHVHRHRAGHRRPAARCPRVPSRAAQRGRLRPELAGASCPPGRTLRPAAHVLATARRRRGAGRAAVPARLVVDGRRRRDRRSAPPGAGRAGRGRPAGHRRTRPGQRQPAEPGDRRRRPM